MTQRYRYRQVTLHVFVTPLSSALVTRVFTLSVIECNFKNGCCVPYNVSCERAMLQAKLPTVTSKVLADGNRFEIPWWAEFE
jgi:hypothetical protein